MMAEMQDQSGNTMLDQSGNTMLDQLGGIMAGTTFNTANWSGYDEQSATNPSGAITDFSLLIVVEDLSATFKSTVQSDGADIRLTKGDNTVLAYDLIDWAYNAGAPTGLIRVKWSGTLAASGTQNVRIWAGYTLGTAVAYDATETFGSDNTYDSGIIMYLPDGGNVDRTSNAYSGTANGGVTIGGGAGPNGEAATDYDGTDDYVLFTDDGGLPDIEYTLVAAIKYTSAPAGVQAILSRNAGASDERTAHCTVLTDNKLRHFTDQPPSSALTSDSTDALTANVWSHVGWQADSAAKEILMYLNGSADAGNPQASLHVLPNSTEPMAVGAAATGLTLFFDGLILHAIATSDVRSAAWIDEEKDQVLDNASFWGTWAWTATITGGDDTFAAITEDIIEDILDSVKG